MEEQGRSRAKGGEEGKLQTLRISSILKILNFVKQANKKHRLFLGRKNGMIKYKFQKETKAQRTKLVRKKQKTSGEVIETIHARNTKGLN